MLEMQVEAFALTASYRYSKDVFCVEKNIPTTIILNYNFQSQA